MISWEFSINYGIIGENPKTFGNGVDQSANRFVESKDGGDQSAKSL